MPEAADRTARRIVRAVPLVLAACGRREIRPARSQARVSPHLARILDHLDANRPVAAGELARQLRVTPATASLQVSRLLKLRLVTAARDAEDGRRVLLRLSQAGARLRESRTLLDPVCVKALLRTLSAVEREQAAAGIESLGRAARQAGAESSPRPTSGSSNPRSGL